MNRKITILRRYDMNGAWTHDEEIRLGEVQVIGANSMWRPYQVIDLYDLLELKRLTAEIESTYNLYSVLENEDLNVNKWKELLKN